MRNLITADDILRSKPSAVRTDAGDLADLCLAAMSEVEACAGRRFFAGKRVAKVLPTGNRLAQLPDPPLATLVSVVLVSGSTSQALAIADFGIEEAQAGTVWAASGWHVNTESGAPRSELDRNMAAGFPGSYASEPAPHHWLVTYTSGSPANARATLLARELVSLWIDRLNRQGVTSETFNRVSRSFDFDKAEAAIRSRCRKLGGKFLIR